MAVSKLLYTQLKPTILESFRLHESDTGSSDVQYAILSSEIAYLKTHVESNRNDISARKQLLQKIADQKVHTAYLIRTKGEEHFRSLEKKVADFLAKKFNRNI